MSDTNPLASSPMAMLDALKAEMELDQAGITPTQELIDALVAEAEEKRAAEKSDS